MKLSWVIGCLLALVLGMSAPATAKTAEEWYAEGFEFSLEGKDEQGVSAFRKALKLKPGWAEAHHGLAVLYSRLKDGPQVIYHLRQAQRLYREHPGAHSPQNLDIVRRNLERAYALFDLEPGEFERMESLSPVAGEPHWKTAGNGFLIDGQGHLLTLLHRVLDAKGIRVRFPDGHQVTARLVRPFIIYDVALLRLEGTPGVPAAPGLWLGDSSALRIGDKVYAPDFEKTLGSAQAGQLEGRITHLTAVMKDERIVQMDLDKADRQSGGPLFNEAGEVVGIILSKPHTMENFQAEGRWPENEIALKSSYLRRLLANVPGFQPKRTEPGRGGEKRGRGTRNNLVIIETSQ